MRSSCGWCRKNGCRRLRCAMSRLDACIIVCPVGARCTRLARCALSYFWFASFYVAKGYKLQTKRTPFAAWNVPFCNALIVRRLCGECECLLASAFCRQFLCPLPCAGHAAGILLFVVVLGRFCRVAAVAFSLRMSPRWFCWFYVFVRNISACSVCQRPLLLSVRSAERYVR